MKRGSRPSASVGGRSAIVARWRAAYGGNRGGVVACAPARIVIICSASSLRAWPICKENGEIAPSDNLARNKNASRGRPLPSYPHGGRRAATRRKACARRRHGQEAITYNPRISMYGIENGCESAHTGARNICGTACNGILNCDNQ